LTLKPNWFWSNKAGPLNGAAMLSSLKELTSYSEESLSTLLNYVKTSGAPAYADVVKHIKHLQPISHQRTIRKLTALADYEGKTRVIAIGDYLSNVLLKPCHDVLMKCLKGIDPDYTHKQHTLDMIKLRDHEEPVSVDLTAATDRIPSLVTANILGEYFADHAFADSWYQLMTQFKFRYYDMELRGQNELSYSTGQPMGLYSS